MLEYGCSLPRIFPYRAEYTIPVLYRETRFRKSSYSDIVCAVFRLVSKRLHMVMHETLHNVQ